MPEEKTTQGPPPWLFKNVVNPIMKTVLRSPLHGMMSGGLAIIKFTGRKSGKTYTTPVAYHMESENVVYVFTRSNWWKNIQNGEAFTLRIKGKEYNTTAEIIDDPEAVWELISKYIEKYDNNYRRVGVMAGKDTPEEVIRASVAEMLVVKAHLK